MKRGMGCEKVKLSLFGIILSLFFLSSLRLVAAPPVNMYHEPILVNDVKGPNLFLMPPTEPKGVLDIMPYFENTSSAKNAIEQKVNASERLGRWSMLGLIYGTQASPQSDLVTGNLNPILFPALANAQSKLFAAGLTESNVTDSTNTLGKYSVPMKYEQWGIRVKARANFAHGVGAILGSGFATYNQKPMFVDLTGTASGSGLEPGPTTITLIENLLMDPEARRTISEELGLDFGWRSRTAFEDTYLSVYWANSYRFDDYNQIPILDFIPYAELGVWIPTGRKKDENAMLSLPTGNQVWGVFLRGALNFNFPNLINIGFGADISIFGSRTDAFRLPTDVLQSTIYPWKVVAKKEFGPAWDIYGTVMCPNFLDKLSFYSSFIFARKEADHFDLKDTAQRNALFEVGRSEEESVWWIEEAHFGFDYKITPNLTFGICVQVPVAGMRVYRPVTILGTMRFNFL